MFTVSLSLSLCLSFSLFLPLPINLCILHPISLIRPFSCVLLAVGTSENFIIIKFLHPDFMFSLHFRKKTNAKCFSKNLNVFVASLYSGPQQWALPIDNLAHPSFYPSYISTSSSLYTVYVHLGEHDLSTQHFWQWYLLSNSLTVCMIHC